MQSQQHDTGDTTASLPFFCCQISTACCMHAARASPCSPGHARHVRVRHLDFVLLPAQLVLPLVPLAGHAEQDVVAAAILRCCPLIRNACGEGHGGEPGAQLCHMWHGQAPLTVPLGEGPF